MIAYRLKHTPTGLYYQPNKGRGSSLSKRGKIYQTNTHGLSYAVKWAERHKDDPRAHLFEVFAEKDGPMHRLLRDKLNWVECRYRHWQVKAETNLSDWVVEPIII